MLTADVDLNLLSDMQLLSRCIILFCSLLRNIIADTEDRTVSDQVLGLQALEVRRLATPATLLVFTRQISLLIPRIASIVSVQAYDCQR